LFAADSEKEAAIVAQTVTGPAVSESRDVGGGGYQFVLTNGVARVPVVVVGGTPYQMGWHLGRLLQPEIQQFIPAAVAGLKQKLNVSDAQLDHVWATTAAFTDLRFAQELVGLADGSGVPVRTLQQAHCLPLLAPYSCSSVAVWGKASSDGHLYQTLSFRIWRRPLRKTRRENPGAQPGSASRSGAYLERQRPDGRVRSQRAAQCGLQ